MTKDSADGRPPTHGTRLFGWKLLAIIFGSIAIAGVVWAVTQRTGIGVIVGFVALVVAMIVLGAAPVLGAGLLRGKEERTANKQARNQLNLSPTAPAPPPVQPTH